MQLDQEEGSTSIPFFAKPEACVSTPRMLTQYAATLAACYAPEVMFTAPLTPVALLLKHTWAPGFLLCGAACLVLKGAAGSSGAEEAGAGSSLFRR